MASRIHPGRLKDLHWEAMWESKVVANLTRTRFQDASEVKQRLGTGLEPVRDRF